MYPYNYETWMYNVDNSNAGIFHWLCIDEPFCHVETGGGGAISFSFRSYNHRQIPLIFSPDNGKQKHLTSHTMIVYPSEVFVIVVLVTRVVIHFMLFTLRSCSSSSHKNDKGKSLAVLTRQKWNATRILLNPYVHCSQTGCPNKWSL